VRENYYSAIQEIFPENTEVGWRGIGMNPATEWLNMPSGDIPDPEIHRLISFLNRLKMETGIRPHDGSIFRRPETIDHFMVRAMQRAMKMGILDRLRP